MEYLFVYGTLLSFFHHPLNQKIMEEGEFIGKGRAKGILYDAGDYPVARPSQKHYIF